MTYTAFTTLLVFSPYRITIIKEPFLQALQIVDKRSW